ncbi:MAG: hypothetical protein ACI31R_01110 [Bacilli bacterium]
MDKIKKILNKKKVMIPLIIVLLILCAGVSFAIWNYSFLGEANKIETGEISLELLESNTDIISIENALPISDKEGKEQSETFNFAVITKASMNLSMPYELVIEKLETAEGYTALSDDEVKVYLEDYEGNTLVEPVKISELSDYVLYTDTNVHSKTVTKLTDKYKLRVWIDSDVEASKFYDESADSVKTYQYKFKIGVMTERAKYQVRYNANGGYLLKNLSMTSTGDYPWEETDGVYRSGNYNVSSSTSTITSEEFTLTEISKLSFDWAVSSEGSYDYLYYTIYKDGEVFSDTGESTKIYGNYSITDEADLTYTTIEKILQPGSYTLEFNYIKATGGANEGLDRGYVKNIKVDNLMESDIAIFLNSEGDNPWEETDGVYRSGNYNVSSSTSTLTSNEFTLTESLILSFDWAVSSESADYDYLYYTIYKDGEVLSDTGESTKIGGNYSITDEANLSYTTIKKELEPGTYKVEFNYTKDSSVDKGLDRGYLKNMKLYKVVNSMNNSTYKVGISSNLSQNLYIKAGYDFVRWSDTENGEVLYQNESEIQDLATEDGAVVDLYAIWKPKQYNVNLVVQNGTIEGEATKLADYNSNVTFNVSANDANAIPFISCTNGQNATIEDGVLTTGNIKSDTTCTLKFATEATTLYTDGTLIINELASDRSSNIETHGAVIDQYEAM